MKSVPFLLVLLVPLACTTPELPPVLLEDLQPRAEKQQVRQWFWGQYVKKEGKLSLIYFIFNENNDVTDFYQHTVRAGNRTRINLGVRIRPTDEEGVRLTFREQETLRFEFGTDVKEKRVHFFAGGKECRAAELTFPPPEPTDTKGIWVFEIINGLDLPGDPREIVSDPRAVFTRQYERNRPKSRPFLPPSR